jgi:hypothetical protein
LGSGASTSPEKGCTAWSSRGHRVYQVIAARRSGSWASEKQDFAVPWTMAWAAESVLRLEAASREIVVRIGQIDGAWRSAAPRLVAL